MIRFGATLVGRRALLLGILFAAVSAGQAVAQEDKPDKPDKKDATPKAEDPEYRFDFYLFGGGHFFTQDHALGRVVGDSTGKSPKSAGMFGGEFGLHLNRWIGFEGELAIIPTRTRNDDPNFTINNDPNFDFTSKMYVFAYRGSFVLNLNDHYWFQPFLLAGYGGLTSLVSDSTKASAGTESFVHAGLGFKIGITPMVGIRFDGRISVPWTALPVIAVLLAAGSAIALVGGRQPRLPLRDRTASPPPSPPEKTRPIEWAAQAASPAPILVNSLPPSAFASTPEARVVRRLSRQEHAMPPAPALSKGAAVSAEAQSLANALARWRRDGNAEAALALLDAHERLFVHGALSVEAKVAQAEILLALGRRDQALVVLDSLHLASLPRVRELRTLRGELRAQAGRCRDAHTDLSHVILDTATDDLGKRASLAMAKCP